MKWIRTLVVLVATVGLIISFSASDQSVYAGGPSGSGKNTRHGSSRWHHRHHDGPGDSNDCAGNGDDDCHDDTGDIDEPGSGDFPHIPPQGPNLIPNPDIVIQNDSTTEEWGLLEGASLDDTVSRDNGTGSLRLKAKSDGVTSAASEKLEAGKQYIASCYIRSDQFPSALPELFVQLYDASGNFVRNGSANRQSVSKVDDWEECVYAFVPNEGEVYANVILVLTDIPKGWDGSIWVDSVYLGTPLGFREAPSPKIEFNGSQVRVDALGNVEYKYNGAWTPIFPLCMYGDKNRPDWSIYSKQGFNVNMWAWDADQIRKAKAAVSDFNPDGMLSGFSIAQYILPSDLGHDNEYYNDLDFLEQCLGGVKEQGLMDSVLWYYWDNENAYDEWEVPLAVTDMVKSYDLDDNGDRMHPIYQLNGNDGIARRYNNEFVTMGDIQGDYVSTDDFREGGMPDISGASEFPILQLVQNQVSPTVVAQINYGIGRKMRPRLYAAIAKGAKGMGFWRDTYNDPDTGQPVENLPWWDDFPNLRKEIDAMLPLIRNKHWTDWQATSSNSLVYFGTRDYDGFGHLIVANEQDTAQTTTFTLTGLPDTPSVVKDFFTDEVITPIEENRFDITVNAYGSGCFVLQ